MTPEEIGKIINGDVMGAAEVLIALDGNNLVSKILVGSYVLEHKRLLIDGMYAKDSLLAVELEADDELSF